MLGWLDDIRTSRSHTEAMLDILEHYVNQRARLTALAKVKLALGSKVRGLPSHLISRLLVDPQTTLKAINKTFVRIEVVGRMRNLITNMYSSRSW